MVKTKKPSAFRQKVAAVMARAGRSKRPRAATVFQKTFTGSEVKYQDVVVQTEFDTTGNPTLINTIGQGSDNTQRIGRQLKIVSIMCKGFVQGGSVVQVASAINVVRQLVVYDKQPNGALPTISDVLVNGDVAGQLNLNNKDRFVVLWDEIWQPPANSLTEPAVNGQAYWAINKFRKVKLPVIYSSTGSTVASISSGSLVAFHIGNQAAAANKNPISQINYRVKFTDD